MENNDNFYLEDNLNEILKIVEKSKKDGNNDRAKLIAVSKTFSADKIEYLYNLGIRDFGESRVQEFLDKYEKLSHLDINWHFIGHLQKNKVKYIVDKVYLIHSVDSLGLANEINKQAEKHNLVSKILVQVNISNDEKKFGVMDNKLIEFIDELKELENVEFSGLMTILVDTDDDELKNSYYNKMLKLSIDILDKIKDNRNQIELSMGMSSDFDIAIKNGATLIRVGTRLFGKR